MVEPSSERVRAHVWVQGRVQGVGFRAHVDFFARQIGGLTGWVRNVGYDTVEVVVEGNRPAVEQLIEKIRSGPRGARVDETRIEWETATGEFADFNVRRSL
ncbi:MAG: acylphosphatase [Anaerolineae bacterium]